MPISALGELLRSMEPVLRAGEFVFVGSDPGPATTVFASVIEAEGPSFVVAREDADRLRLDYDFVAAWITLTVHSALEAVGLTAAFSAALGEEGISCNVIAGLRHDHLLVPLDRADDAIAALRQLSHSQSK